MTDNSQDLAQMKRLVQISLVLTGINTLAVIGFAIGVFQVRAKLAEVNTRVSQVETKVSTFVDSTREGLGLVRDRIRERLESNTTDLSQPNATPTP